MDQETGSFTKQVAIKATDDDERIATGVVLTPDEIDHQGDFVRPNGVRNLFADSPDTGVMHAYFPEGSAELVRNEVLDENKVIDGVEFEADEWVISRQYSDDSLWQLVKDGILGGFSIGGEITEYQDHGSEELPDDVSLPDSVSYEGNYTELLDGEINEVSDVDIPAVPKAEHAVVKTMEKSLVSDVSGESEFVEVMSDRGHSDDDARRLWAYLQDLNMSKEQDNGEEENEAEASKELGDEDVGILKRLTSALRSNKSDDKVEKAGRTLSNKSVGSVKAIHDASEDLLWASGEDQTYHRRYTDDPNDSFDIASYGSAQDDENDKKMTEENTEKSIPEQNAEAIAELTDVVKESVANAEKEEDEEDEEDEEEEEEEVESEKESPQAEKNAEAIAELTEAVEQIGKQSGASTQIDNPDTEKDVPSDDSETEKMNFFVPSNQR